MLKNLNRKRKFAISLIIAIAISLTLPSLALAAAPYPTLGTAVVDGAYGEWDLVADFFADMYRAGDDGKATESKLYLRYDVSSETVFVLVLEESPADVLKLPDDALFLPGRKANFQTG